MKKNIGTIDIILRVILALGIFTLNYLGTLSGLTGTISIAIASVFILTSLVGFCPLYKLIGFNSCSNDK